ncbi:MAG: hypothetical protein CFH26_00397 [Alphaproteobacteria bacterium MarineAlpha6_Bin4]|nr:MAG: hypothetical protein CFH25_00133 [Alphaproteobacteria bacterium MarineAlpha6_Bin3]PPR38038.1 MAG: hypothetical protein CFH26_00397 [Alphaproteobacteria bacterium MarineAlpha6_Bin4]|tara:strand:- start:1820 stop:2644 length:825 start_codon:yes stop_codon:yes gene_type:complete
MTFNNLFFIPMKKEVLEKKNYLLQSLGLHFLIIILIYYGLPNLFKYRSEFLPPLPVEIINISEKTTAPKINFKKSPDAKKNKTNYVDQENIKYDKQSETVNEKTELIDSNKEVKVKKKIVKLKELKKKPNQLQSVLKSIEQIKRDFSEKKKEDKNKESKEKVTPTKLGINLSISEVDAIRRHFEKCWNIPSGAREAGNLATEIKVRFNKEGNVLDARIVDIGRMKRDRYFRTAAESALRAVLNPSCQNAPLPANKFDKWKNLTLNFDPKSIIGY